MEHPLQTLDIVEAYLACHLWCVRQFKLVLKVAALGLGPLSVDLCLARSCSRSLGRLVVHFFLCSDADAGIQVALEHAVDRRFALRTELHVLCFVITHGSKSFR